MASLLVEETKNEINTIKGGHIAEDSITESPNRKSDSALLWYSYVRALLLNPT